MGSGGGGEDRPWRGRGSAWRVDRERRGPGYRGLEGTGVQTGYIEVGQKQRGLKSGIGYGRVVMGPGKCL